MEEFIGQESIKKVLNIFFKYSNKKFNYIQHILIFGNHGSGKTTLSKIIAKNLKKELKIIFGQNIKNNTDLINIILSLTEKNILFIDEVHSMNMKVAELLYSVLEENFLNLVISNKNQSKILNLSLPKFTVIAATTKPNTLPRPLFNRFNLLLNIKNYSFKEIEKILFIFFKKNNVKVSSSTLRIISFFSRKNPRIALSLAKKIFLFLTIDNSMVLTYDKLKKIFKEYNVYLFGFSEEEIQLLSLLDKYKTLSLNMLSRLFNKSNNYITNFIEPFLVQNELLLISTSGRSLTKKGKKILFFFKKIDFKI